MVEARALEATEDSGHGIDLLTRTNRRKRATSRSSGRSRHAPPGRREMVEAGDQHLVTRSPPTTIFRLEDKVPTVTPAELTPEILRAAILGTAARREPA